MGKAKREAVMAGFYDHLTYGSGNPFIEAKLKIKRAERHLDELTNAARELPRMRNYSFVIAKREPGKLDIIFIPQNPMPMEFGVLSAMSSIIFGPHLIT